jgi:Cu2+-exporting ATPase/Cu+-exporting ATPase
MERRSGLALAPAPSPETYAYVDTPEFRAAYSSEGEGVGEGDSAGAQGPRMYFHLEGVHCAACVGATEGVADRIGGVRGIRLNLGNAVASVQLERGGTFAPVARAFAALGYRPVPVRADEIEGASQTSDRRLLTQLGVAGACAGNIMLLTTSLYAGAAGSYAQLFRWGSFGLSLPVLFFSAIPFYQGAWRAIRSRQVSIDLPIALGILLGGISSIFNLFSQSEFLYFDSLTMLVFLMLSSRYLMRRTQQQALSSSRLVRFLSPAAAHVWNELDGKFLEAPVDRIRPGDLVQIRSLESIPIDGVIVDGKSTLNVSLLTGESLPVEVSKDSPVYAGTVNEGDTLVVKATSSGTATRLGQILKGVEEDLARKSDIATFSDRIARGFVTAVLLAVAVVFLVGLRTGLHEAINLALALSIVTCPCAFALGTPLALSLAIGKCARAGVLIKGPDVLERLSQVKKVFIDKTGTLTEGKLEATRWVSEPRKHLTDTDVAALTAIELRSTHAAAQAIVRFLGDLVTGPLPEVSHFAERPGIGVLGTVGGHSYEVSRGPGSGLESGVIVRRDGEFLGTFRLGDIERPDSATSVKRLVAMGLSPEILSGDSEAVVKTLAVRMNLGENYRAGASPEKKRAIVAEFPGALMVGDGANDAAALAAAHVGVAVRGGMEVSLRSAGAYSRQHGVATIPGLVTVGRETMRVIHRNFLFSLIYNAIGIAGVLEGRLTPLFAAVLMPVSAFTVFLSSIAGTRAMRRALKEMRG